MVVRHLLDPVLGDALPYITSFAAIAVAAWQAGWKAGLLCALLSQVWVNYFFIPPRNAFSYSPADLTGIVAFYVVTALLIYPTERARRALRERDAALEKLRAESVNKSHFLGLLAHELRGPVHTANLALELADRETIGEERRRDAHALIRRQIESVQRLCADLMDTARTEQKKMTVERGPATLGDLLNRSMERTRPAFERRNQVLRPTIKGPEQVELFIDLPRMVQAFSNLLENASKYSPAGTTVVMDVAVAGDTLTVRFIDEGRGFDPSHSRQLFDTFFQVAPGSEGLGLGLPLVREIVELHGGQVSASSGGLGLGATFIVTLPGAVTRASDPSAASGLKLVSGG
jgi:signal transduction histidine kinase